MPELPELQAHAERLADRLVGIRLEGVDVLSFTALKTATAPDPALGRPLQHIGRRGKHLIFGFGPVSFVVHLMQGGRIALADPSRRPRGGLIRWRLEGADALVLTEAGKERRAGVWVVEGDPLDAPPLDDLGPDADSIQVDELGLVLAEHSSRLHGLLRDQHAIAGVGRRLANEVCYRSELSPFASTSKLGSDEVGRLHTALHDVVSESLTFERGLDDMSRAADRPAVVHDRKGRPCPRCGDPIRSVEYRSYTVFYCPGCQTGGKVLADNVTSRFLK